MQKTIVPSVIRDNASVYIPSSKSLSHRALIAASLAHGVSRITSLSESADTEATRRVLSHLGVRFEKDGETTIVHGMPGLQAYDGEILDCGESGSTLRFLIPLFSLCGKEVIFLGQGRLMKRPQSVYEEIFKENHLLFDFEKNTLHLKGPVPAGKYTIAGNVSSQFISGLLFALPLLEKDSVIEVREPFESRSYVSLTLDMLKKAGIFIKEEGNRFGIGGGQIYRPFSTEVEGDDSQAAFFALLGLVQKKRVTMHHLNHDSHQGDHILFSFIEQMGGHIEEDDDGYQVLPGALKGIEMDLADCPDLGPALFALATQCEGETVFHHAGRLRMKESDRIAAMEEELHKLGCTIVSDEDTVMVHGKTEIKGGCVLDAHQDHRIAMALSSLSTIAEKPVILDHAEAVNKSYPQFFADLEKTGVKIL